MNVALLLALAVVGPVNWWSRWREDRRVEAVTKPLFTVLAGVLCAVHGDGAAMVVALVAFACCLVGDVALLPAVNVFLAGLGAFLLGHVLFAVAFVIVGLDEPWLALLAAALLLPLLVGPGRGILRHSGGMRGPVTGYLVVISTMMLVAWATGRPAAMIGAAAFVVSDTLLGWAKFVRELLWMPVAVMVTYHLALVGLALSFAS